MKNYPEYLDTVMDKLENSGHSAFFVGGCVRDFLMKREISDFDITTSAKPSEIKEIFCDFKTFDFGIKHGTISVLIDGNIVEITTFRKDGEYTDFRRPSYVEFTDDIKSDLSRRDFTINAMAYNRREGLVDFFGGEKDIAEKTIKTVGNPNERFREDALRILRAVRFSSVLKFSVDKKTFDAMLSNSYLLENISAERKAEEFVKLLLGDGVKNAIISCNRIIARIFPELADMDGFNQNSKYHSYDLLRHTALTVANSPKDKELRLASIFHDAGKMQTYTEKDGEGHFYGHSKYSVDIAERVMKDLKFDNTTIGNVKILVEEHDTPISADTKIIKKRLQKFGAEMFFKIIAIKRADNLAQNPEYFYRQNELDRIENMAREILQNEECFSLKHLAIDGYDLIKLGFFGKQVGELLNFALESVIQEKVENDKEKILFFLKENYGRKNN